MMVDQAELHLASLEQAPATPPTFEVRNPSTGQTIGSLPIYTRDMVAEAVKRARAAQPAWAAIPIKERARILCRFADLIMGKRLEGLIETLRRENGKARGGAFAECSVTAFTADFYAKNAPQWLLAEKRAPAMRFLYSAQVYHKPIGVVGNISPWNYPLVLSLCDMIPALVAGNAVVVKPSEITPYTTLEAAKILAEAGLPDNIFQVVTGYGETGSHLVDCVDYIMFTGSTATGRKVAVKAAERLIPYSLELGGNDAMIVLRDADLEKAAANAVAAAFENTGQLCMSVERILVEAPIYEDFLTKMQHWTGKIKMGTGAGLDTHVGSLTNERELKRTQAHVDDALAKGGRLVCGAKERPDLGPWFYEPTIIADANAAMLAMQDETFGPLVMVQPVKDAEEAIQIANSTNYGLSSVIWTKDIDRARQLGLRLESGDVNVNCAFVGFATPSVEFGGVKDSGVGRRNGKQGLLKYTTTQTIVVDNYPQKPSAPTIYTGKIVFLLRAMRQIKKRLPFLGA
jgi:succinate-semialdehyde dehydrogenase/glutarate-semialdehyde dehydrogenase